MFLLSSLPGKSVESPIPDYVAHTIEYFTLGTLLLRALNGARDEAPGPARCLQMALLCVVWGVLDELHQSFVPGRTPSAVDVGYDAIGALLAALAFPLRHRLPWRRRLTRSRGTVLFLERHRCPLCDAAWTVLERVLPEHAVDCERIDVDARPELSARWGNEVPVVLLDGEAVCRGRIDERALRGRLAAFRGPRA